MDHIKQPKAYVSPALLSVPSTSSSARSPAQPHACDAATCSQTPGSLVAHQQVHDHCDQNCTGTCRVAFDHALHVESTVTPQAASASALGGHLAACG